MPWSWSPGPGPLVLPTHPDWNLRTARVSDLAWTPLPMPRPDVFEDFQVSTDAHAAHDVIATPAPYLDYY